MRLKDYEQILVWPTSASSIQRGRNFPRVMRIVVYQNNRTVPAWQTAKYFKSATNPFERRQPLCYVIGGDTKLVADCHCGESILDIVSSWQSEICLLYTSDAADE